jgi:hypothetical protein
VELISLFAVVHISEWHDRQTLGEIGASGSELVLMSPIHHFLNFAMNNDRGIESNDGRLDNRVNGIHIEHCQYHYIHTAIVR